MTREEIIQAIIDDKTVPFIQPEQLSKIVNFVIKNYKPSLPSNPDEAAEKAYKEYDVKTAVKPKEHPVGFLFFDGFKAGAEWMAGQGETVEGVFKAGDPGYPDIRMGEQYSVEHILRKPSGIEPGDKVVVQIRKK